MERYSRNYMYLSRSEQQIIKDYPVLIAGCGIGSNIAECAIRLGFENLTIIDGDHVELTNLNRQNYTTEDIGGSKVEALYSRLNAINQNARIPTCHEYLDEDNILSHLRGIKVAINALDYDTAAPQYFDQKCQELGIPVLHPYNLGWAGLLTTVDPNGMPLESINQNNLFDELVVVEFAVRRLSENGIDVNWLLELGMKYKSTQNKTSPPQLAVGSWLIAAMCTDVLFRMATGKEIKYFPDFYFMSIKGN